MCSLVYTLLLVSLRTSERLLFVFLSPVLPPYAALSSEIVPAGLWQLLC